MFFLGSLRGSILGPTLFLLYINDLPLHFDRCLCDLYADDAIVHIKDGNVSNIEDDITLAFDKAIKWSKPNKMQVHFGKTTCKQLGTRQRLNTSRKININIDNTSIDNVSEQKFLGLYIENLTWSTHIDHFCSLISSKISLLRQLSDYVPTEV